MIRKIKLSKQQKYAKRTNIRLCKNRTSQRLKITKFKFVETLLHLQDENPNF